MNILFHTFCKLSATSGGTERTTLTVASTLKKLHGVRNFSIYEAPANDTLPECFEDEFLWRVSGSEEQNVKVLRELLQRWKIDVVIVQGAFIHVARFRKAMDGLKCKLILAHHFAPGWEAEAGSFMKSLRSCPQGIRNKLRWIRKIALYPHYSRKGREMLRYFYGQAYQAADAVVLLSEQLRDGFMRFGDITDASKFRYIPNGLTFPDIIPQNAIEKKEPTVLIVSRLEEIPKRISTALQIWKAAKADPRATSWQLKIIGHGPDESRYRQMVRRERIPDVTFMGRMNPWDEYCKASIFMMTSQRESWGLTLTEAQQTGTVPVAFNTYLTLPEIITDGHDGLIIPPGDLGGYTEALLQLMADKDRRHRLAVNGLTTCQRFSPDHIASLWHKLTIELMLS